MLYYYPSYLILILGLRKIYTQYSSPERFIDRLCIYVFNYMIIENLKIQINCVLYIEFAMAKVRAPSQTSEQNTKTICSVDFWQKL